MATDRLLLAHAGIPRLGLCSGNYPGLADFGKGNPRWLPGPEPGAQVLEPLHLTRILGPPPDVYLHSLLSFFVFLCLSVCMP